MICPRCNQTCKDDEIYCHCCGNKLKDIDDENIDISVDIESESNTSQNVDDTTSTKDMKFPWLLSVIVTVLIIALICVIILW